MLLRHAASLGSVTLIIAVLVGCPGPAQLDGAGNGTGAGTGGGAGGGAQSGVPCDVAAILQANCLGCHGSTPSGGAPMPLVTYDDLAAASPKGGTYGDRSLVRMKDTVSPMPPKPAAPLSAADIATFDAWVSGGMAKGDCGNGGGGPYDTPEVCTSNSYWSYGDEGSPDMLPGQSCVSCHKQDPEAPLLYVGGTVYPTAHEPDNCSGYDGTDGTTVEITDAMNKSFSLPVRPSGNFMWRAKQGTITMPIHAKVVRGASVREMVQAVDNGDCNSCHTLNGSGNPKAPGRIMSP